MCPDGGRGETESSRRLSGEHQLRDVVEPALARALVVAAEQQRWDVVVQIAAELQSRREGRERGQSVSTRPMGVSPLVTPREAQCDVGCRVQTIAASHAEGQSP